MEEQVLKISQLSQSYDTQTNLSFKDFAVGRKEHTLILGDSGKGKSTLLHLLAGLSKPTSGKVFVENTDIYQLKDTELDKFRSNNIGIILQEAHLLKSLNISENIGLAQHLAGNTVNQNRIDVLLKELQLDKHRTKKPNQLSRGQIQRVAIARALINQPAILLADEPTASLDDTNTQTVLQLLLQIASEKDSTLIIATHDKRVKDHFSNTYNL